jgi:hypothetical protein
MLRASTPLPKRPAHEAELLDEVLAVFAGGRHLNSAEVVRAVNHQRALAGRLPAAAVDVRLVLQPPYFQLQPSGRWKSTWTFR